MSADAKDANAAVISNSNGASHSAAREFSPQSHRHNLQKVSLDFNQ
jgi:hypothetical protein